MTLPMPMHSRGLRTSSALWLIALLLALAGCASRTFPTQPTTDAPVGAFADGLSAQAVFDRCLAAHGGDIRKHPGDFNLSTDGRWFALIQRIQPLVTDSAFRIRSEERYRPSEGLYAVRHTGPSGAKYVVRSGGALASVHYNGVLETDPAKLRATAMTNDAFLMFHFGPSYFIGRVDRWQRLADTQEDGRRYRRLSGTLRPGFGDAADDRVIVWIDADNARLFRIHMTLNGFETTQGAHVDTTFLAYRDVSGYLLPVRFHERVRGPLQIDAHTWWATGIDTDRGWSASDVTGDDFAGAAEQAAKPISAQ
jgi:hypothetical protein